MCSLIIALTYCYSNVDVDECLTSNGGCSQICNNTIGSFECLLTAENMTCNGMSVDSIFSYGCNHQLYYSDVNECVTCNGSCSQICSNTIGSYTCSCAAGYMLSVDNRTCLGTHFVITCSTCILILYNIILYKSCFSLSSQANRDINEWATFNGNCSQLCSNTIGSYMCSCFVGYFLSADSRTCEGIEATISSVVLEC